MPFLALVEAVILFLAAVFLIFQVVIPLWMDKPIFPVFRRRRKLENEIVLEKERIKEVGLEEKIESLKQSTKIKKERED